MDRQRPHPVTLALAAGLCLLMAGQAFAGGDSVDGRDEDPENGAPFFGEAKDVKGLKPISAVRVRAEAKSGSASRVYTTSTDAEGQFRFAGFGKDVDTDSVQVTCELTGYRSVDITRRRMSSSAEAPVEVECLLERE